MMYDDMYNVKFGQDTLYESLPFNPLKQIRVSCTIFKVTSFVDFGPYLKPLNPLEKYVRQLEEQLMDIVRNPDYKFIKQKLYTVIYRIPTHGCWSVRSHKIMLSILYYVYANSSRNLMP